MWALQLEAVPDREEWIFGVVWNVRSLGADRLHRARQLERKPAFCLGPAVKDVVDGGVG